MSIPSWIGSALPACAELEPNAPGPKGLVRALAALGVVTGYVLAGIAPVVAQDTLPPAAKEGFQLYRVEVIIFEQLQPPRRPEDPGPPPLPPQPAEEETVIPGIFVEQARPLPQAAPLKPELPAEPLAEEAEPLFFEPVDVQDLTEVARSLERRPGYRVLAREAWRQPGFSQDQSRPVDLETVARLRRLMAEAADGGRSPPLPATGEAMPPDGGPLEATATLWLGRYLHLKIEAESFTEAGVGRLAESRRMRSGEVHYFDSPRLGAIAIVIPEDTPVESEEGAGVTEETSDPARPGPGSL
jgi:hypothetical protein